MKRSGWVPAILATAMLAGCGSSTGLPSGVVAQVGHFSITKAADEHAVSMVTVQVARSTKVRGSVTQFELAEIAKNLKEPRLIVPVPPHYMACIARVRKYAPKPTAGTPPPSTSELRGLCERIHGDVQQEALGSLITADWDLAEASQEGISVSEAQVRQQLQRELHSGPHPVALQTVLNEYDETMPEVLQATEVTLLRDMLNQRAIPNHAKLAKKALDEKLEALERAFEARWTSRTTCRSEYVIKYCKGYKPPPLPKVKRAKAPPPAPPIPVTPPAPPSSNPPVLNSEG